MALLPLQVVTFFSFLFLLNSDCFRVYDLNDDKYISKEEIFHMLKHTINQPNEEDPDEGIKDMVEITMKKMVRRSLLKYNGLFVV